MTDRPQAAGAEWQAAPAISVVVPAFNAARFLLACLDSVRSQTMGDWECLVVDDGSEDASAVLAEGVGDPRVRVLRQANAGVAAARNRGLSQARGEMVLFLDADDRLHASALERLASALRADVHAVASFGPFRKILADGSPYPGEKPLEAVRYPSGDVLEALLRENFIANGGHVLVRSAAARRAGGFDTRLRLSEDWEFWCRLALEGPFRYIGSDLEVMSFRIYATSTSGGLARDWENHRPALTAVLGNPAYPARLGVRRWRRLAREIEASHLWEAGRVNFTYRDFSRGRALMLASLRRAPTAKRLALFGLAQLSQALGRGVVSRLRFRDEDLAP